MFALPLCALMLAPVEPADAREIHDPKARETHDPRVDSPAYRAIASRAQPGTPELDGALDDPAWERATPITGFMQRDPNEGEPATERTEVRVLYDDHALYVGVRAYDSDPSQIVGRLTRRDQHSPSDWLVISIDSYFDRRTAFDFWVNPAGVERDIYRYDDTRQDDSWDAVWDVAVSRDAEGWAAEFRIPFSQLRFAEASEQTWGFNVTRIVQRKNETALWKPIPKEGSGWVSEYGDLVGMRGIEPGRRLEVLPYLLASEALTPREDGNPFETGTEFDGKVGLDLKYGVTNNLTLDLTVNPDFGQVEADPSVVNLSVFETFFREKRPFFIEGANIFDFGITGTNGGGEPLFYSRRIGRSPQGNADARGGYAEAPDRTTILGAAKLSGKTSNGWSIGVLNALTSKETAEIIDSDGRPHRDVVEPFTNYAVARVQRDFRDGKSAIGAILTSVNRNLSPGLDFLHSAAYAAGLDARHRFWDANWELTGKIVGSHVRGSTEALEQTQQRSTRYFQRPDADHVEFDPTRTSLTGTSGSLGFSKIGGGHWRGSLGYEWVAPSFEANDLGFLREADIQRSFVWVAYREFQPGDIFRNYNINLNAWNFWTFGGERTATGGNVNGNFTLLNYWGGWGGVNRSIEAVSTRVLRGGPAMKRPGSWNAWYGLHTDNRKPVVLEGGGWIWADDERSHSGGFWTFMQFRPRDNVRLTFGPEYSWNHDDWQFVDAQEVLGADQYIMGVLDQKTISLTTRLDWTFTPNMSLQLYAQPFVSSGDYLRFRRVTDPLAERYSDRFEALGRRLTLDDGTYNADLNRDGTADLSFNDPDFTFAELRSTLVLRWEYVSGSTIFLVWQQNRSSFVEQGDFRPGRDFGDLLTADGDNVFLMKVNYYLTP